MRSNLIKYPQFLRNFKRYQSTSVNLLKDDKETHQKEKNKRKLPDGPNLNHFLVNNLNSKKIFSKPKENVPYVKDVDFGSNRKVFFDVYGCQMNVNDTEIVWSILKSNNFVKTDVLEEADVVLIMTCSIRDSAEERIWGRLDYLRGIRNKRIKIGNRDMKVGILGCMAERLKEKVLEKDKTVDIIAGPDSYKDLPRMLALTENNQTAVNVLLSLEETYADITPVRLNEDSVTAFVSIMRGCDNMCTYCIVPFTRGRERSRPVKSILNEVKYLSDRGVKEITLLGQNVNSYRDVSNASEIFIPNTTPTHLAKGFKTVYKSKIGGLRFADLLERVSSVNPELRIRFTSPHPKDFPDEVLHMIREKSNICKNLHLPAQSGNTNVLERMRRGYTREIYLELVEHIREILPDVALSSDFICGFCGETDEEFDDTLSLIERVRYNNAYLFPYSMREKTTAHRRYEDNVPEKIKLNRLQKMVSLYRNIAETLNRQKVGELQLILIEGHSKRSKNQFQGRNDSNVKVIIPAGEIPVGDSNYLTDIKPGDYIVVQINDSSSQTLKGIPLYHTTLQDFHLKYKYVYPKCHDDYIKWHGGYLN
ncbi:CDK5RAP1-like protein [Onthophagus taurus]|uniref:CDK5RAP1-like protein n=1 Tax=Onthophagus taurus TaxID=166361 RepID=UPI0039BDC65C